VYDIGWLAALAGLGACGQAPRARRRGSGAPELSVGETGPGAAVLIPRIDEAAHAYPWAGNNHVARPEFQHFTAWVLRAIPELEADLPPTAIGKDYSGEAALAPHQAAKLFNSRFSARRNHRQRRRRPRSESARPQRRINPFDPA